MMKKVALLLCLVFLISTVITGCSAASQPAVNSQPSAVKPLIVGMELAYPPFETKDAQGNPSGVSVDLAKALGGYLQRPVQIENISWDGLIPSLQTGKVDLVISSMTITEERAKTIDFSIPYAHAYLALLVNTNSGVDSIEDLKQKGKIIDVKKGTTGNIYATKNLSAATINALTSENACVTEVVQGKADAFIYDQLTIYRQHQANPQTTKALLIPFQDSENWGIAVKKDNKELLTQINAFLLKYKGDGGFNTLTQKYLQQEKQIFDQLKFPWFFD